VNQPEQRELEAPTKQARLSWTGEGLAFEGDVGGPSIVLDGDGAAGPSPTDALLLGLAACIGIDLRIILRKSRVPLTAMDATIEAWRAPKSPRRFTEIQLVFRLSGPSDDDEAKVERAMCLSRDKYCSVLHSLREDIAMNIRFELT
jgi:putative redox protein